MITWTEEQLVALEKQLISDLESVRRVRARDNDPDIMRVSVLLGGSKPNNQPQLLETPAGRSPSTNPVSNKEIRQIIMKFAAPFKFVDVVAAVRKEYPDRLLRKFSIPAMLMRMKRNGKIKEVSARDGRNGAVYAKI